MKTAVCTALWGKEDSSYVRYLPSFVQSLNAQTDQEFDVIFFASQNLLPVVTKTFRENAPDIYGRGRIKICALRDENRTNLKAAVQRFDYFFHTEKGRSYDAIALLDADDMIPPQYLVTMKGKLKAEKADIIAADFHLVRSDESTAIPYLSRGIREGSILTFNDLANKNCMGLSNVIIRPHVLKLGNYERLANFSRVMEGAPDWPIFLVAISKGVKAVFTSEAYVLYRQHENLSGITRTDAPAVEKSLRLKADFYPDLAEQVTGDHRIIAVNLAESFHATNGHLFTNGKPNLAFHDYAADQAGLMARRYEITQFWDIATPVNV